MADARSRAASVLQTFQQAVLDTSHVQVSRQGQVSIDDTLLLKEHGPAQPVAVYQHDAEQVNASLKFAISKFAI